MHDIITRMKRVGFFCVLILFIAGCGPVTQYDGVFDPDSVEIDEDLLLDVDEDIIEEQ